MVRSVSASIVVLCLVLIPSAGLGAQALGPLGPNITGSASYTRIPEIIAPERSDGLWQGLRLRDARAACRLILDNLFLIHLLPEGKRETVRVKTASFQIVEKERLPPPYPDGTYQSRWDLVVNGVVIDPRDFALVYDGRVLNLGALYTYAQEFYPANQAAQYDLTD